VSWGYIQLDELDLHVLVIILLLFMGQFYFETNPFLLPILLMFDGIFKVLL
jgi:hypothetical protein